MKRLRLLFFLLIFPVCNGLPAQTFSLVAGREPVASLDGLWRFHTGDDLPGPTRISMIPSGRCCAPTKTGRSKATEATTALRGTVSA